jgi:hypothetical protein
MSLADVVVKSAGVAKIDKYSCRGRLAARDLRANGCVVTPDTPNIILG